jgi:succinate-acetate transporter protein
MQATTISLYSLRAPLQEVSVVVMHIVSVIIILSVILFIATSQPNKNVLHPGGIVGIMFGIVVMILILAVIAVILWHTCWNSRKKGKTQ